MPISYEPLFKVLREKNLKLADLNKDIGISKPTLAKFNKNMPVSLSIMILIAEYLECDIGDLVTIRNNLKILAKEETSAGLAEMEKILLPERYRLIITNFDGKELFKGDLIME